MKWEEHQTLRKSVRKWVSDDIGYKIIRQSIFKYLPCLSYCVKGLTYISWYISKHSLKNAQLFFSFYYWGSWYLPLVRPVVSSWVENCTQIFNSPNPKHYDLLPHKEIEAGF